MINKYSILPMFILSFIAVFGCGAIFALDQSAGLITGEETIKFWLNFCQNAGLPFLVSGFCLFTTILGLSKTGRIQ